jgi:DNA-binding protein H-NS
MHNLKNGTMLLFLGMKMPRANLGAMSVEALIELRDEIGKALNQRAVQLQSQLSRLGGEIGNRGKRSSMKGRKVPVKYRDKAGNTWAGRGAHPVWLREKIKAGAKLNDFAVQRTAAARKSSPKKARKRRRKK